MFAAGCDSRVDVRTPRITLPTVPTVPTVTPAGAMATEVRAISGVSAVSLKAVGMVEIDLGQAESLTITAPESVMPLLTSEVAGGRLDLDRDSSSYTGQTSDIHYQIGLQRLDELMLEGVGEIDARGVDTSSFVVRMDGVGDVKATGRAERQEVRIAGLGAYAAPMLESRFADVHLSSGSAEIWVTERIEGWVGFGATLEYWGDPVVSVRGQGAVRRLGFKP
jgi:hypothetical protein